MAGDNNSATPLNLSDLSSQSQKPSDQQPSAAAPLSLSSVSGIYHAPEPLTEVQKFEQKVQSKVPEAEKEVSEHPWTSYVPSAYGLPLVGEPYRRAVTAGEAALGQGKGATFEERQADLLAQSRARDIAKHAAAPVASSLIQGTAEAIPSIYAAPELGIEAAASKTLPYIKKGAGYAGRMLEQAIYGGSSAAQQTTPGETAEDAAKRIGVGAAAGAAGVPVATVVGKAVQAPKAVYNWASKLWNPEQAVAKDIAAAAANVPTTSKGQGLTVEEYAAAKARGEPVTIADIQGAKPLIAQAGQNLPTDQRIQQINDSLQQRLADESSRVGAQVDTAFGKPIDAFKARKEADDLARSVNKPAYDAAYASPEAKAIWNDQLKAMVNTNEGKQALDYALNESKKEAAKEGFAPIQNPFIKDQNGNLDLREGVTPDLSFWDHFKRGLGDVSSEQFNKGARTASRSTQEDARTLTDFLRNQVPEYGIALDGAGKFIRGNNAHDEGMSFLDLVSNKNADPKEVGSTLYHFNNTYNPDEKKLFGEGVAADIKENPVKAAKIFANNDSVTMDRLKSVIGEDAFNQIDSSMRLNRIMALSKEIGKPPSAPLVSPKNIAIGAGSLGLSTAAGAYLPKLVEALPNIVKYGADPMALAATGAALSAGALGAGITSAGNKAKTSAILGMALSNDPKYTDILLRAAKNDAEVRDTLDQFEKGLSRYLAVNHGNPEREGRKSGGSVIDKKSDQLINETMRNQKLLANHTEQMLSMPDDAIVQALKVAKSVAA